jgi:hypothetical protein
MRDNAGRYPRSDKRNASVVGYNREQQKLLNETPKFLTKEIK